jgi:carbamoyl-phosphate synthase large subunit
VSTPTSSVQGLGGFPVLVRPSYVLSGAAMSVAHEPHAPAPYLAKAREVSPDHPVVITKFETNAKEIEIDAVADRGELVLWAISEHIENAGVHSGDATLVLPPQTLYVETINASGSIGPRRPRAGDHRALQHAVPRGRRTRSRSSSATSARRARSPSSPR